MSEIPTPPPAESETLSDMSVDRVMTYYLETMAEAVFRSYLRGDPEVAREHQEGLDKLLGQLKEEHRTKFATVVQDVYMKHIGRMQCKMDDMKSKLRR